MRKVFRRLGGGRTLRWCARRFTRPARPGFTLIELLVVVAVLALLVAMVSPSMRRVKDLGVKVKCASRLRQIREAAHSFRTDNRGKLVTIHPTSTTCFSDAFEPYQLYEEFFHCPGAFITKTLGSRNKERLDYGINHYGRGNNQTGKFWNTFSGLYFYQVGNPNALYFCDAEADKSPEDIGGVSRGTMEWPIRVSFDRFSWQRHLGGHNIVQFDGAVKWYLGDPDDPLNELWFIRKVNKQ